MQRRHKRASNEQAGRSPEDRGRTAPTYRAERTTKVRERERVALFCLAGGPICEGDFASAQFPDLTLRPRRKPGKKPSYINT